jgi:hypothetical protein
MVDRIGYFANGGRGGGRRLGHSRASKNSSLARCRLQEFAMSSKINIVVNKYNRLAIMLAKRVLRN